MRSSLSAGLSMKHKKEDTEMKVYRDEIPVVIIIAAIGEQIQGRYSNIFT